MRLCSGCLKLTVVAALLTLRARPSNLQEEEETGFAITKSEANETTLIKVGLLYTPEEGEIYDRVTLELAERNLRSSRIIPENVEFEYILAPVDFNSIYDEAKGVEMRLKQKIDVIIGPPRSAAMIPIATMAVYWDMPVFAYFSTFAEFSNKALYQTLVRVCPTLDQIGDLMKQLCKEFNWDRVALVYATSDFVIGPSLQGVLEAPSSGIHLVCKMTVDTSSNDTSTHVASLQCIKKFARVVFIYFGNDPGLHRDYLLIAREMGMTNGEYVYIMASSFRDVLTRRDPWLTPNNGAADGREADAQDAYRSALFLDIAGSEKTDLVFVNNMIKDLAKLPPYNLTEDVSVDAHNFASTNRINLYNSMYLYGLAVKSCMDNGVSYRSGKMILKHSALKAFSGICNETVYMNANSERNVVYLVKTLDADGNTTTKMKQDLQENFACAVLNASKDTGGVLSTNQQQADAALALAKSIGDCSQKLQRVAPFNWPSADGNLPPDSPSCGFQGERCLSDRLAKILPPAIIGSVLFLVAAVAIGLRRHRNLKYADIVNLAWRIDPKQLLPVESTRRLHGSTMSRNSRSSKDKAVTQSGYFSHRSNDSQDDQKLAAADDAEQAANLSLAIYRKAVVNLTKFRKSKAITIDMKFQHLKIMKSIMDVRHENLNAFLGFAIWDSPPEIAAVWHHGAKGSLLDIIGNSDINLDFAFKSSIVRDIVSGLDHLHNRTTIGFHGFLKSSNCLVSSRWVVQLSDFGLPRLLGDYFSNGAIDRGAILPMSTKWKEQDVSDFAVILYEVVTRSVFPSDSFRALEHLFALERSQSFLHEKSAADSSHNAELIKLFQECQNPSPDARPAIATVRQIIYKHSHSIKNLVDHMMNIMEKYASNLEGLVGERTALLQEERKRADHLLYQLLPKSVADNLKQGLAIVPEFYDGTTVYFNDIVGFTTICSESSPIEVVDMLNKLYQNFDAIIGLHDCYKVETIGDAYMVVSGAPKRNGDKHVTEVTDMALQIMNYATREFVIPHMADKQLMIRIGIHSGPVAAGVIGLSMPKYCLFGDTVNVASRMESNGQAGKIHISWTTKAMLANKRKYVITARGQIQIKGKGLCETFWLEAK